jgi:hypothetical protein
MLHYKKAPYIGREFLIAGECNGDLRDYWCGCPHGSKLQHKEIKQAEDNLDFEFMDEKGLIIADFSPRNFERLDTFMGIAKEEGRKLVVLAKDAYLLEAMKCVDCRDRMRDLLIYRDLKATRLAFEKQIDEADKVFSNSQCFYGVFFAYRICTIHDIVPDSI